MLNKNFEKRVRLVGMAMEGIVAVTVRNNHGNDQTFRVTLLPGSLECAKQNADYYYASIGSSRYKEQQRRKKEKEAKKALETKVNPELDWKAQLDRSINMVYAVDADEFRWRPISVKSIVAVEGVEYIGRPE